MNNPPIFSNLSTPVSGDKNPVTKASPLSASSADNNSILPRQSGDSQVPSSRHRQLASDVTLKQSDFDQHFWENPKIGADKSNMLASRRPPETIQSSIPEGLSPVNAEKMLPSAPLNRTASEAPIMSSIPSAVDNLSHGKRPSASTGLSFQRPRKRIQWRGKTCVIAFPIEESVEGGAVAKKHYLNSADFDRQLTEWQRKGFGIRGFDLSADSRADALPHGQSCDIYPNPHELVHEWRQKNFRVNIPDRKAWEDYVDQLKEEKLRALGVSFGDEELHSKAPPTLPSMSRETSTSTMPTPIVPLTSSVGGNNAHSRSQSSFASPIAASTNLHARPPSMISPGAQQTPIQPETIQFPRQPSQFSAEQGFAPAGIFLHQRPTPPLQAPWVQKQYLGSLPGSRGVSPLVNPRRQSIHSTHSPVSPLPESKFDTFSVGKNTSLAYQSQQTNAVAPQPQYQQLTQQQSGPGQRLTPPHFDNHEEGLRPLRYVSQPEIASPRPQGHRQNLSETLQKEIDDAEYHLEESVRRQLDEDDNPSPESINEDGSIADVLEGNGVGPRNGLHVINQASSTTSDLDTNPSASGTPKLVDSEEERIVSAPDLQKHAPKSSVSKLNVNAEEFIFKPSKLVTTMFAFSGNAPSADVVSGTSVSKASSLHSRQSSNASPFMSTLNVEAPAFQPSNIRKAHAPAREFSFSSSLPALKPDAPSFNPLTSGTEESALSTKLFGIPVVVSSGKRSKAIPIVKPRVIDGNDSENQEDAEGRVTQAKSRQKRARRIDNDDDQVPRFITPSREVSLEHTSQLSQGKLFENHGAEHNTSTSPAEKATYQLKELVDLLPSDLSSSAEDPVPKDMEVKLWEPFEFHDVEDAAIFNAARPLSATSMGSRTSDDEDRGSLDRGQRTPVPNGASNVSEDNDIRRLEDSPPSAAIRSFGYSPDVASMLLNVESGTILPRPISKVTGLEGSRYAPAAPPTTGFQSGSDVVSPLTRNTPPLGAKVPIKGQINPTQVLGADSVPYDEPSLQEIDAVMRHLNGSDPDLGVERVATTIERQSPLSSLTRPVSRLARESLPSPVTAVQMPLDSAVSEARQHLLASVERKLPSSSPNRLRGHFQYQRSSESSDSAAAEFVARNTRFSPSFKPRKHHFSSLDQPVHQLNDPNDLPISDWDEAISSTEDPKLHAMTGFFDYKINDAIGHILQQRLRPLEQNVAAMNELLARMSTARSPSRMRSVSAEVEKSDADDEDDEATSQSRPRSPVKDRKYEKMKASILESISAQPPTAPVKELTMIRESLAELKNATQAQASASSDVKAMVEETVAKQMRGKSAPITSSHQSATAEKFQLQIDGLESMLKVAEARADDELRARRAAEDELVEHRRLLRAAQLEAAAQRESAEETERSLRAFHDERLKQTLLLQGVQGELEQNVSDLTTKNEALEETLEEYRLSHSGWRDEIEDAKIENNNLDRTIHALKSELEDGIRGRQALRSRLDRLQEDMTAAARDVARDQSQWRYKEEEHKARHDMQNARLEAEARTRERLELEIERLEGREKEAMKSTFLIGQVQGENDRLVALVTELKRENYEHQKEVDRCQRGLYDARETGRLDMQRVQSALEADMTAASQGINIVRTDLEGVIARLERQLEDAKADAVNTETRYELILEQASQTRNDALRNAAEAQETATAHLQAQLEDSRSDASTAKARYELMLEEASQSRSNALREAAEAREAALQEHYRFHERTLNETKTSHGRELASIIAEKQRAVDATLEGQKLIEDNLNERVALSNEKMVYYQERVAHLEEKLDIAKSAAQAAAQAAQTAQSSPGFSKGETSTSTKSSSVPGKLSPQAMRETIDVLQEQLRQGQNQVEQLEHELASIDKDAPAKIKERDIEISWLRELLGVRTDDLQEIINTLSLPSYDADAVRDAAIRLKANLQMEQQEKERAITGGQTFPSLASISNLAASPRSLPLAAAAAWGNWRKGQSSGSRPDAGNGISSANQTPSKSSPHSFLSGLLTPPSTSVRQSPGAGPSAATHSAVASRPRRGYSTPRAAHGSRSGLNPLVQQLPPPETPPLLRPALYDEDAESGNYSLDRYVAGEEDEQEESVMGGGNGGRDKEGDDGLFGPRIGK